MAFCLAISHLNFEGDGSLLVANALRFIAIGNGGNADNDQYRPPHILNFYLNNLGA